MAGGPTTTFKKAKWCKYSYIFRNVFKRIKLWPLWFGAKTRAISVYYEAGKMKTASSQFHPDHVPYFTPWPCPSWSPPSACKNIYHSFKVFRRFRLAPIPRLNVQNHMALTIFGRCEQYAIHSMVYLLYIFAWKRGSSMYIDLETRLLGQ